MESGPVSGEMIRGAPAAPAVPVPLSNRLRLLLNRRVGLGRSRRTDSFQIQGTDEQIHIGALRKETFVAVAVS